MKTDYFAGGEGILAPADASVAIITVDRTYYLMQRRDQRPGIFYPGHWGLFGGAKDSGENQLETLRRELREELSLDFEEARYFTALSMDFSFNGHGWIERSYFEMDLTRAHFDTLVLGEGAEMHLFDSTGILREPKVVPYDAFALWMHATQQTGRTVA